MTLTETIGTLEGNALSGGDLQRFEMLKEMRENGVKDVPFVVVAMLKREAEELFAGTPSIFDSTHNENITSKQTKRFQAFQLALQKRFDSEAKKNDWIAHYHEQRREIWIPHLYAPAAEQAIPALLEQESLRRYQQRQQTHKERWLESSCDFWPDVIRLDDLFSADHDARDRAWRSLPSSCMFVIDGFSLFHPVIREALASSSLNSWENAGAALLLSAPEEERPPDSLQRIIERELQEEVGKAFQRFNRDFDPLYAFELTTERHLKRWLYANILDITSRKPTANIENLKQIGKPERGAELLRGGAA